MRNSMTQQRRFTKEFEEEAVRLAQTSGRTQREIAGDLGIGLSTLVRWIGRSREGRAADPAAAQSEVTVDLARARSLHLRRDLDLATLRDALVRQPISRAFYIQRSLCQRRNFSCSNSLHHSVVTTSLPVACLRA